MEKFEPIILRQKASYLYEIGNMPGFSECITGEKAEIKMEIF